MFIDKKYITVYTGEPHVECPPKLYMDFWIHKANLKRDWRDSNTFHFNLGIFNFYFTLMIRWGFVERKRTEDEEDRYQKTKELLGKIQIEIEALEKKG